MADIKRSDVKSIKKASNGRWFAILKTGRTQFLSDEDAKRLKSGSSTSSPTKGKKGGKKKGSKKGKSTKSTTTKSSDEGTRKTKVKKYIGDFF